MTKVALITGISGQDGSYLAELLLSKGYEVHGLIRRSSSQNTSRLLECGLLSHDSDENKIVVHDADITDHHSMVRALETAQPDEIYHLAAQSHVGLSFNQPEITMHVTGLGTLRLLEAIRQLKLKCRFYQAGSSEMFGNAVTSPQNENTPFNARSPYGSAKIFAHRTTVC